MAQQGWVKLHRKMRECWLWEENEPFDKRSAWIDLLLSANHADKKTLINNKLTEIKRGSFITSEVKLSERWKWDRGKVRRFLKLLESDNMLKKEVTSRLYITITIINYEIYQNTTSESLENAKIESNDTTSDEQEKNNEQTCNEQVTNINKNEKNEKNENNIINLSAEQTQTTPYNSILNLFNSICITLPKIKSIEGNRKKVVNSRWKEHPDLKYFEELFQETNKSDFLSGRNDKWKGCCFDWILKPSNLQKILEGNYKNKENSSSIDEFSLGGV